MGFSCKGPLISEIGVFVRRFPGPRPDFVEDLWPFPAEIMAA